MFESCETNQVFLTPNIGANSRKTLILEDSLKSMNKNQKVFIVGICGGQGGGKTKLAKHLSKKINKSAIIEERSYFKASKAKRKLTYGNGLLMGKFGDFSEDRKLLLVELSNYKSYDYNKLYKDLSNLIDGKTVHIKKFDEDEGRYTGEQDEINPKNTSLIILEGYFIFKMENVRNLINLKIFSEIDDDVRLSRLLINENKFLKNVPIAFKHFFMIYEKYIKVAYENNIYPTRKEAKIVLSNCLVKDEEENEEIIVEDETLIILIENLKKVANRNII
jgi:uridine kinase